MRCNIINESVTFKTEGGSSQNDSSTPLLADEVITISHTKIEVDGRIAEDCVICLDDKRDRTIVMPCMHEYCFDCIHKWLGINPECPLCKQVAASLVHEILSDGVFKEEKVPAPVRPEFPGVVYWHRYQPLHLVNNRRTSLPNCTRDVVSRLFAEGNRPPTEIMRSLLYLLNLQTQFQTQQQRVRDHSPSFLGRNPPSTHRLIGFLTRDLSALRIPTISTIQQSIQRIFGHYAIDSAEMLNMLASQPHTADYAPLLQEELGRFAGFTSTQEEYDASIEYRTRNGHVIYSEASGVIGQELTGCIVETLILWTGGSNRSPHMEMSLMSALMNMSRSAQPSQEHYSTLMGMLTRARQHYNRRPRTYVPPPTPVAPYETASTFVYQPSSSSFRTAVSNLTYVRSPSPRFNSCLSPVFVRTHHYSPSTAEDDWSFLNTSSIPLNVPRVAPSPPPEHISPSLISDVSIPSPILSPRTVSSNNSSANYVSDCVIVEHTRTREAIVISSDSSSSSDSSIHMSTQTHTKAKSSRKRSIIRTPRIETSESELEDNDYRLPPKKRRFHFRTRSPSVESSSSSSEHGQIRSVIGRVLGEPLLSQRRSHSPYSVLTSDDETHQRKKFRLQISDESHASSSEPNVPVKSSTDIISSDESYKTTKTRNGDTREPNAVEVKRKSKNRERRKKRRSEATPVISSSGSLTCPILISDDDFDDVVLTEEHHSTEENILHSLEVSTNTDPLNTETSGGASSATANPQLMHIYQPRTVDDFYRYLTDALPVDENSGEESLPILGADVLESSLSPTLLT